MALSLKLLTRSHALVEISRGFRSINNFFIIQKNAIPKVGPIENQCLVGFEYTIVEAFILLDTELQIWNCP
jgi:hypothetical protein